MPEPESLESSSLEVADIRCGDEFDFKLHKLVRESHEVARDATGMFVVVRLRDVPPPGRVTGRWEHLDTGVRLAEREILTPGSEVEAEFSISRPSAGWPEGRYKFYLAVNGEDVSGIELFVEAASRQIETEESAPSAS